MRRPAMRVLVLIALVSAFFLSGCVGARINERYDAQVAALDKALQGAKFADGAPYLTDTLLTREAVDEFKTNNCAVAGKKKRAKYDAECTKKWWSYFGGELSKKYPLATAEDVTNLCKEHKEVCNSPTGIEVAARLSHNAHADEVAQQRRQQIEAAREEELEDARQAFAAAFQAAAQSYQYQPQRQNQYYTAPSAGVPDEQGTYLGNLTSNPYAGRANPYSPNSVSNPYGKYGSPYSPTSATNPYATNTPKLYDSEGNYRGKLSSNPYDPESISNPYGRYGSKFSPDSINNPYGAGSRFKQDSPNNPFGTGLQVYGQ